MKKIKYRYIPQHVTDGHFLTIRCERTNDPSAANRYVTPEDVLWFLYGMYGPREPIDYKPVKMRITYELEDE